MSPRAACRLETLGFDPSFVFDYVEGKADWLANGLPREGDNADIPYAGDLVDGNPPTCALDPGRRYPSDARRIALRVRARAQRRPDRPWARAPKRSGFRRRLLDRRRAHGAGTEHRSLQHARRRADPAPREARPQDGRGHDAEWMPGRHLSPCCGRDGARRDRAPVMRHLSDAPAQRWSPCAWRNPESSSTCTGSAHAGPRSLASVERLRNTLRSSTPTIR